MAISLKQLREMSLPTKLIALTTIDAVAFAIASPIALLAGGHLGLLAATIAAAACLVGGLSALTISGFFRDPSQAFAGVLFGMFLGMGLPLAVALLCQTSGSALAQSGIMYYMLYFFPITLAAKTVLSLPQAPSRVHLDNGRMG